MGIDFVEIGFTPYQDREAARNDVARSVTGHRRQTSWQVQSGEVLLDRQWDYRRWSSFGSLNIFARRFREIFRCFSPVFDQSAYHLPANDRNDDQARIIRRWVSFY